MPKEELEKKDDTLESSTEDTSYKRRSRKKNVKLDLKCPLCESGIKCLTYKDIYQLKKFTSVRGKIISSEKSGMCSKHQRQLRKSIQRARFMALLPYVALDS
ncbi:30S ribosomal protein S18 [Candidatus Dojkabacteria bacterium]|uniref:Small ribosomal subunit protein bS18 n=1 Tax=Candidatus Dojkabacteria bacterium TaxID=2099670 RepID=A0A955HXK1_9BACT|nr:30S ribosomal protein S18 [Candidatus Dojkabacteria bacterium]MCB9790624.1 30S ribosomal protein S18 [Candidatus Nomurabacteria bacterium]